MKRLLVFVAIFLGFSLNVCAQDNPDAPATKADIERYFNVTRSHDMLNKLMEAMAKPLHQTVHGSYEKDKDKLPPDFEARENAQLDEMLKGMPWDEIMQAIVPVYQKHLTRGDVDNLASFYSSPTGQKVLRELPVMMAESMPLMMPIMRDYMDKVNERLQNQIAQIVRESEKKTGKSSTPVPN